MAGAEVHVYGDQAYKDAVSVAAMLRGIAVTNHQLSLRAKAELDRLLAERAEEQIATLKPEQGVDRPYKHSPRKRSSSDIHRQLSKQAFSESETPSANPDTENVAPVLKPRFRRIAASQQLSRGTVA
ncbi:hypothetical protein [Mesorhizobium sp. B2-4-6]|uniref:hypothetical protein n=1 Tax=Mesorhizobium sp. B2-4-6 TaxID=2589943 RepID=UPI00112AF0A3|nr:hypothetical protein [Mesorhizobium sp. B2-4-6]TPL46399.1 hypothetical protein FJ957_16710 [Mesorhizobium sp. B2-4-6]